MGVSRQVALTCGPVLWLAVVAAYAVGAAERPASDPKLEAVIQAARQRQEAVNTVQCTWTAKDFIPKGNYDDLLDPLEEEPPVPGSAWGEAPPEDSVVESTVSMTIAGHQARYDAREPLWVHERREFVLAEKSGSLVDGQARDLQAATRSATVTREGALRTFVHYKVLLVAYRLFDPVLGLARPADVEFVGRAEHRGSPCIVIQVRPGPHPVARHRWWLAEDLEYSVVLWEIVNDDGTTWMQADMQYEKDPEAGWYLQRWALAFPERNRSSANTVTRIRLNEPVDPSVFEVVFPAGTSVYDRITGAEYVADGRIGTPATEGLAPAAMDRFVEKVRKETAQPSAAPAAATPKPPAEPKPAAVPRPVPPPAVAPPRELSPWVFVGGGALVVLILAAIYLSRRRAAT